MRKWIWHKRIGVVIGVVAAGALLPWVDGVLFEQQYHSTIAALNKGGEVSIQILAYQRNWLHSHAKIQVQITDPDLKIFSNTANLDPSKLNFTIDQAISHGPIVVTHYPRFNFRLALAGIQNVTMFTGTSHPILQDEDIVTLTGNYYQYFNVPAFQYTSSDNMHFQFLNGISGNLHYYPSEKRISGNINLINFDADDNDVFISMPNGSMHFDQYKSPSDLWIGGLSILLEKIEGHDNTNGAFAINGIDFEADTAESKGKINDIRKLDIDRMDFANQPIGPFHFVLSATALDAEAIKDMLATYRKITLEGEKYESQLSYKISSMLPLVFAPGAAINLNTFQLKTPIGQLTMQGEINWPQTSMSLPSTVEELISASNAKGNLRISKALSDKVVSIAADLPYFRSITPEMRRTLINMQTDVQLISQQNFLMISYFAEQGLVTDEAAEQLINLQKDDVSLDVYANEVRDLLLKKEVMLAASYLLRWKYAIVRFDEDALDQAALLVQQSFSQQLREQLAEWIKEGFVKEDKEDYVVVLDKQNESIHLNGKDVD